jgi:hypothetical protein
MLVILEQHEELSALSGERWHEIIANDGQLAESKSPDVEDMTEDYSLTEELEYISFYTGSLIEMLPSIRSLRYAYILDLEERHAEERLQVPSDNTTHPIIKLTEASSQDVDNQSTHLTIIRQNVFLCSSLKDALRAEEDFARKEHGPGVTEFSPELEAQENRLKECHSAYVSVGEERKQNPFEMMAMSLLNDALARSFHQLLISQPELMSQDNQDHSGNESQVDVGKELASLLAAFQRANDTVGSALAMELD